MEVTLRITGFLASLILTLLAYFLIVAPRSFNLDHRMAFGFAFILALVQATVQLLCFINIWHEKGTLWNLYVFFSTVSIIFIVVFFSIWIMDHLNYNMMPWHH